MPLGSSEKFLSEDEQADHENSDTDCRNNVTVNFDAAEITDRLLIDILFKIGQWFPEPKTECADDNQ